MGLYGDVRYCMRSLGRTPAFTAAIVLTLALGLAANTAITTVTDAVLLRQLPYWEPGDLLAITYSATDSPTSGSEIPSPLFSSLAANSRTLRELAAYNVGSLTWLTEQRAQLRVSAAWITSNLFTLLGLTPTAIGRTLGVDDQRQGAAPVVVLSYSFWQSRLGGDPGILGRGLTLRGRSYEVIGVAPADLQFPGYSTPDIFFPIRLPTDSSSVRFVRAIGRRVPGVGLGQVQEELNRTNSQVVQEYPVAVRSRLASDAPGRPRVLLLHEHIVGNLRSTLVLMVGIVASVLIMGCVSVASLLVARYRRAAGDIWTRMALGATPLQLARVAAIDATILSALGGLVAVAVMLLSMEALRELVRDYIPHADTLSLGPRSFWLVGIATFFVGMVCASLAILGTLTSRPQLTRVFAAGPPEGARRWSGYRFWVVVTQVALSVALLAINLLLVRTLLNVTGSQLGFSPSNLLTLRVSPLPRAGEGEREAAVARVLRGVGELPDVTSVGAGTAFPLEGSSFEFAVSVEGYPSPTPDAPLTGVDAVSPGYFRTLGVTLEAGREFSRFDTFGAAPVAIVNQAFAELRGAGRDIVGRRLSLGAGPENANVVIVGVIRDFKNGSPKDPAVPHVYRPVAQAAPQLGWHTLTMAVRTEGQPTMVAQSVRRRIEQESVWTAIYDVLSMEQRVAFFQSPERIRVAVTGLFALVAAVLAGIGVLSLVSYVVAARAREFGVRLALGCPGARLVFDVMKDGLVPATIGVVLGLAGAGVLSGFLQQFLYGIGPADGATLCAVAVAVLCIAGVASYIPARRAAGVDPIEVLRGE